MGKTKEEQGPQRWWIGYTEFKLRKPPKNMSYVVKKGSDEVKEEDIKEEEWEAWKVTDREEWSKVEATGAVKTLSMEESQDVLRQLKRRAWRKDSPIPYGAEGGSQRNNREHQPPESHDGASEEIKIQIFWIYHGTLLPLTPPLFSGPPDSSEPWVGIQQ